MTHRPLSLLFALVACGTSAPQATTGSPTLRSACDVPAEAKRLTWRPEPLSVPPGSRLDDIGPTDTTAIETLPFLRVRPDDQLVAGTLRWEGKGETSSARLNLLRTADGLFPLHGAPAWFLLFDWTPDPNDGGALARSLVSSGRHPLLSVDDYHRVRKALSLTHPTTVIGPERLRPCPAHAAQRDAGPVIVGVWLAYVRDGLYDPGVRLENSVVRFHLTLGNGVLEVWADPLIRGPYNTMPLYWEGENAMAFQPTGPDRERVLREYHETLAFQTRMDELLAPP